MLTQWILQQAGLHMRKSFKFILCTFALLGQILWGDPCSRALTIIPGVGINGIVTIGMTVNEAMGVLLKEENVSETRSYSYDGLSGLTNLTHMMVYEGLGVSAEFNSNGLVRMIEINVKPSPREQVFSGVLAGELLIGGKVDVSKDAVVKILGELRAVSAGERVVCMLNHIDCSYRELENTHDIEVLYYHSKGIYCLFTNGTLQRIGVFSPRKPKPKEPEPGAVP